MFVITLRFADRTHAPRLMEAHRDWIARGFERGILILVGTLQPGVGGMLIAHGATRGEIEAFIAEDPFVAEGVVTSELLEIDPGRTDARLAFLQA